MLSKYLLVRENYTNFGMLGAAENKFLPNVHTVQRSGDRAHWKAT